MPKRGGGRGFGHQGRGGGGGGGGGHNDKKLTYKQKSSIRFIDPSDPPFLRAMKQKMGYQEYSVEDKFSNDAEDEDAGPSQDPDDIRNMKEAERPQVVVLNPERDLTEEDLDVEVKKKREEDERQMIEDGRITFKKPVKRNADGEPAEEEKPDEKKSKTDDKKGKPDPKPKKTESRLLSFGGDDEDDD